MNEEYLVEESIFRGFELSIDAFDETTHQSSIPYFVVTYKGGKHYKYARLHYLDNGVEYHNTDSTKADWQFSHKDAKRIAKIMASDSERFPQTSLWKEACFRWNQRNAFIPTSGGDDEDRIRMNLYLSGAYDSQYYDIGRQEYHLGYVPATAWIPDPLWKWHKH